MNGSRRFTDSHASTGSADVRTKSSIQQIHIIFLGRTDIRPCSRSPGKKIRVSRQHDWRGRHKRGREEGVEHELKEEGTLKNNWEMRVEDYEKCGQAASWTVRKEVVFQKRGFNKAVNNHMCITLRSFYSVCIFHFWNIIFFWFPNVFWMLFSSVKKSGVHGTFPISSWNNVEYSLLEAILQNSSWHGSFDVSSVRLRELHPTSIEAEAGVIESNNKADALLRRRSHGRLEGC